MKLVVLDRDGVINRDSDAFIKSPAEFIPITGSLKAIGRLKNADYQVVIATNQSGIGRGLLSEDTFHQIQAKLTRLLKPYDGCIDAVFFCPHVPDDHCDCRKPKVGLLQQIAKHFNIELDGYCLVGDALRDLEAAHAMHMQPVLVKTGKGEKTFADQKSLPEKTLVFDDLATFVEVLLAGEEGLNEFQ